MVNPLNPLDFGLDYYIANKPNDIYVRIINVKCDMENRLTQEDEKHAEKTGHQLVVGSDFLFFRLVIAHGMCINRSAYGRVRRNAT